MHSIKIVSYFGGQQFTKEIVSISNMINQTLNLFAAYEQLSSKAKNRLRYCQLTNVEELRVYLNNPKSMKETQGVGKKTFEEFQRFLGAIEEIDSSLCSE